MRRGGNTAERSEPPGCRPPPAPLRPGDVPLRPVPAPGTCGRAPEGPGEGSQLIKGRETGGKSWDGWPTAAWSGGLPGKHLAWHRGLTSVLNRVLRGFQQPPKWDLQGGMFMHSWIVLAGVGAAGCWGQGLPAAVGLT